MCLYVLRAFSNVSLSVLKSVREEVFWRNYFYRVSLIKQSAQLTALAAQQQAAGKEEKSHGRDEDLPMTGMLGEDLTRCKTKSYCKNIFNSETLMSLSSCVYQKCHCHLLENSFLSRGKSHSPCPLSDPAPTSSPKLSFPSLSFSCSSGFLSLPFYFSLSH